MNKTIAEIAKKFVEAQTRREIDEIFEESCQNYKHSSLSNIARLVAELHGGSVAPELLTDLESQSPGRKPTQVHYAEYLLRTSARKENDRVTQNRERKIEQDQDEGKEPLPLDFMRLFNFAENFLMKGDWRAKTIAVRLFTGRRAGEILYRSTFAEEGEYAIKVTYLAKVPKEQQSHSAVVPTLIPAREVIQLIQEIRDEWHSSLSKHWQTYNEVLRDKGRKDAGEAIKANVQNPVVSFFNDSVRPVFPELSQDSEDEEGAHSLRGVYGCLLYRLMGGHDSKFSEKYMQQALVHVSGAVTSEYRRYSLINFEPILDRHPGLKNMLKLKLIGWTEQSPDLAGFTIESLTNQISDEIVLGQILTAIGDEDPDRLGAFLGGLIAQGIEARKQAAARDEQPVKERSQVAKKGSTTSGSAKKIQSIIDAVFVVNEKEDDELVPNTTLIQQVYKRLYEKNVNLATCRSVLDENADRISALTYRDNRHLNSDKMEALIEEVIAQHGQPL